ncbi:hypothetical protein R3P38DRAFT_2553205 [Favolaschia claudopus]|uniref:MYND-type domain-containing protein n=1 Tax=Favolaschia claudopus TaxID=2862362 RepID=A0AAW0AES1_9AGAR
MQIYQRVALRILHPSASRSLQDDFQDLMQIVHNSPTGRFADFLPVFYHFIDPSRVPREEQLDGYLTEDTVASIASASWCLIQLYISLPPVEAGVDLWPRIWGWTRFFWTYGDFLRQGLELGDDREMSLSFLRFSWYLWKYPPNRAIMLSSPGLTALTVSAWVSFTDEDFTACSDSLHMIRNFLVHGNPTEQEILDGVDDNVGNLAHCIMRQCEFVVPLAHDSPTVAMENIWLLEIVMDIVIAVDHIRMDTFAGGTPGPLTSALIAFEFVKTVSISVHTLSAFSSLTQNLRNLVKNLLMNLCHIFQLGSPEAIQTAVQLGLLHVILCCARWHPADDIHRILHFLLAEMLGPYSVYCGVLAALESSHAGVISPLSSANFSQPGVYVAWTRFAEALCWRTSILNLFRSRQRSSPLTACDNVECENILEKIQLKRCSGCKSVFYCSRSCQAADWRDGHRTACVWYPRVRSALDSTFTREEYAFMRLLLQQDHLIARAKFVSEYAQIMRPAPNVDTILAGFFDYRAVPVSFKVYDFPAQVSQEDADYWSNIKRRVFQSSGRMSLDLVQIKDGGAFTRSIVIPLRRVNTEVPDALRRVLSTWGSAESTEARREIEAILRRASATDLPR